MTETTPQTPRTNELRERLTNCPGCGALQTELNTPANGIPDGYDLEAVYQCGARVFVDVDQCDLQVGTGCPEQLQETLNDIAEHVLDNEDA